MKLQGVERLRGAAIVLVLVHHLARTVDVAALRPWRALGWTGVDLFFVVSGFVVTRSLVRALDGAQDAIGPVLRAFWLRRAFRLLPLAFLGVLLPLAACAWCNQSGVFGTLDGLLAEAGAIARFAYNYEAIGAHGERLAYYWSLTVEEHFYFVLPWLFLAVRDRRLRLWGAAFGVILVAFVVRPLVVADLDRWRLYRYASHERFDGLLVGVVIALLPLRMRVASRVVRLASWLVVAAIGLAPGVFSFGAMLGIGSLGVALLSAWLVREAARDETAVLSGPFVARALEVLGARSYALYLLHMPVLSLGREIAFRTQGGDAVTLLVAAMLLPVVVELCHRLVELPAMRLGRRLTASPAPVPETVPAT